ncbi:hypothetical protein AB6A40_010855 [Gnathostoma spinigerum]|uniref:Tyrosinase copper-binding domain-containing protein n=1 Tax=Gnathostoma spinigerum TaxID=75299 RepID=A0ABD6F1Y6_9BILA
MSILILSRLSAFSDGQHTMNQVRTRPAQEHQQFRVSRPLGGEHVQISVPQQFQLQTRRIANTGSDGIHHPSITENRVQAWDDERFSQQSMWREAQRVTAPQSGWPTRPKTVELTVFTQPQVRVQVDNKIRELPPGETVHQFGSLPIAPTEPQRFPTDAFHSTQMAREWPTSSTVHRPDTSGFQSNHQFDASESSAVPMPQPQSQQQNQQQIQSQPQRIIRYQAKSPYECMDLGCLCSFMRGKQEQYGCVLSSGKTLGIALRKEYRQLSAVERKNFHEALEKLKQSGEYDKIAAIHAHPEYSGGAHSGPAFLPWHREYVKRFLSRTIFIDRNLFSMKCKMDKRSE